MQDKATLYLLVGYPGSGKTTASRVIHLLTGAAHIWTDHERRQMFGSATHSEAESRQLYDYLNRKAGDLLASGTSVVFDTNFNFRRDRDKLRALAREHGAATVLIWLQVDKPVAKGRATKDAHLQDTRVFGDMSDDTFESITGRLEEPSEGEHPIILDGTRITPEYVAGKLGITNQKAGQA